MAYIIIPIFVDDIEDIDNIPYGNILRVLKSLRTTDSGVVEYFLVKDNNVKNARKIMVSENYAKTEKKSLEINLEEWNNKLKEKLWCYVDLFNYVLQQVREFREKNKRLPVKSSKNEMERKLENFCHRNKILKRRKILSEYKINQLEKIIG